MDHSSPLDHSTADHQGSFDVSVEYPMSSLMDGLPETQHNQLLEMLHVSLLHGGVKEAFLLPSFTTYDSVSFTVACILLAITACILELLRLAVWYLEGRYMTDGSTGPSSSCACRQCILPVLSLGSDRKNYNTIHNVQQVEVSTEGLPESSAKPASSSSCLPRYVALAGVGALQMLTYLGSTLLMLVAMTMNVFLILSLGAGASLGKIVALCLKRHLKETRK